MKELCVDEALMHFRSQDALGLLLVHATLQSLPSGLVASCVLMLMLH